jgi:hypothetical protein
MTRRNLVKAASVAAIVGGAAVAAPAKKSLIEIRQYKLRNGAINQRQILSDHISKGRIPALKRAGAGPIGVFTGLIAADGPFLMQVTSFPDFATIDSVMAKLAVDADYQKSRDAMLAASPVPYVRMESSLLRGFDTMPGIEVPPTEGRKANRIFELRTYESNNMASMRKKEGMFDNGEIAIFRQYGLIPVFFGETVFGRNMPNLTYMVAFDDLAAREKNWKAFGGSPEWQKLRSTPGLSDPEIVSNITNSILSPLPFSEIR